MTHAIAVAVAVLMLDAGALAAEPQTYRQILTTRPAPRVDDLAERAAPYRDGDVATESFWDLLKLRDAPNPAAVAALIKVVDAHGGSSRIHRFAAGQALLTAGNADALQALERDTSRVDFPADLAVLYTSHWEMPEPARSQLLERYLLRSAGDGALRVAVAAAWQERDGARVLTVTLTLTNRSEKPLAVLLDPTAAALGLYFKSPDGTFVAAAPQMRCIRGPLPRVRLAAGASERMEEIALTQTRDQEALARSRRQSRSLRAAAARRSGSAAPGGTGSTR